MPPWDSSHDDRLPGGHDDNIGMLRKWREVRSWPGYQRWWKQEGSDLEVERETGGAAEDSVWGGGGVRGRGGYGSGGQAGFQAIDGCQAGDIGATGM